MKSKKEDIKKTYSKIINYLDENPEINFNFNKNLITADINSKNPSFLIGSRGETLNSLEYILRIISEKYFQEGEFPKIIIDINDYKKKNIRRLQNLANNICEKVIKYNRIEVLPIMNSYERRIIHLSLKDNNQILCESIGEDPNRRIIIKPK